MPIRRASIGVLIVSVLMAGCGGGDDPPRPPVIGATSFAVDEDQTLNGQISVSAPAGGSLLLTVTSAPGHGSVNVSNPQGPSANFTYSPDPNYFGSDSFSIRVSDTRDLASEATVTIDVRSVNDPPLATADTIRTAPGAAVNIPVLANDSDVETAVPQVLITTPAADGTATVNANGTVTFTPNAGFAGVTSFQYQLNDEAGATSASVAVSVRVGPLKNAVYLAGNGSMYTLQYYDGDQSKQVPGECGLQSPTRPVACQRMLMAPASRGLLFQGRVTPLNLPPGPAIDPYDDWKFYDFATATAPFNNFELVMIPDTPTTSTAARLSPNGVKLLVIEDIMVGPTQSSRAVLLDFLQRKALSVHDATGTNQVRAAEFSLDGLSVLYRTNAPPATSTNLTLRKAAAAQPQVPVTLLSPLGGDASSGLVLRATPDGSLLLYLRTSTLANDVRAVETTGSMTDRAVGPVIDAAFATIRDYAISPSGRYVAIVTRSNSVAPAVYLADLQTNAYQPVGPGFSIGTSISVPKFRSDSDRVMLQISSATESALYEAAVDDPGVLSRVSASYATAVTFPQFEYAGSAAVYLADPEQGGVFALFAAQAGTAVQLNANAGTSVEVGAAGESFRVSSDGTTVLYSQFDTDGIERVFMVDVTTPGLPIKLVAANTSNDPMGAVRARGHLPQSLGFDFYP